MATRIPTLPYVAHTTSLQDSDALEVVPGPVLKEHMGSQSPGGDNQVQVSSSVKPERCSASPKPRSWLHKDPGGLVLSAYIISVIPF